MRAHWPNRLKLAVLCLVYAGCVFAIDKAGVHDLASPWLGLAVLPLCAIYLGERIGRIDLFRGISLPALLLFSNSTLLVWLMNTRVKVPLWIGYLVLILFVAALVFTLLRIWAYREKSSSEVLYR